MESTPPKEIRMLSRFGACLVCRRRKLRCDATQPQCNRCRATGQTCQYQDAAYRSRIRVLQDRIKEIEAKIREVEQRRGRSNAPSCVSSSSSNNESVIGSSILPEGADHQSSSPASSTNRSLHRQAPDPSPCLDPNILLRRGPSNLSLPGGASRKLLSMFLQRKQISGFELHIGRVVRSFQPGSSEPAVPALFNAMLLLGCHFISEPELQFWENMFYERTKLEIEANIARAHLNDKSKYNPLHHLQAMVMLGQWFYLKGRLLEGHVYVTRATRFAIALGLHELDSRIYGHYVATYKEKSHRGLERWSPRDPIELGEAINLWWSCFLRDYGGTILNGIPPSISLEEITTVWPVALSQYEDTGGSNLPNDNYSVPSIFDPDCFHVVMDVSQATANCILAKSTILTHSAGKLDVERTSGPEVTDEWWARFEKCDRALERFTQSARKAYVNRDVEDVANIALANTAADCAIIQLHAPLADFELDMGAQGDPRGLLSENSPGGYSYVRCMEACRSIALTTAYIKDIDTSYMQMFFGISWTCAARVLEKQIPRLSQNGYMEQVQEMEQQLTLIAKNMERLLLTYPILALQAEYIRELLR
ncbi:hypothetical protein OPQ81_010927 [Rhizoctonia solani]|nr:hypothetical protein OPQ81_010927 [Rhizoctonia solani]